eukprot:scaffold33185_cov101-Isochrysis_galbana.AAC.2
MTACAGRSGHACGAHRRAPESGNPCVGQTRTEGGQRVAQSSVGLASPWRRWMRPRSSSTARLP